MTDQIVNEAGPFITVPAWLIEAELPDRAFRLYCVLRRYADNDTGKCFPSRATLAKRLRCSRDTVDRALKELVAAGAVSMEATYTDHGDRTSNLYTVHWNRMGADGVSSDAATDAADLPGPSPRQRGRELEPSEPEPEEQGSDPSDADGDAAIKAANLRAESFGGDEQMALADRVTRHWWEATEPRPTPPGGFPAVRKIVRKLLVAGWGAREVRAALPRCDGWISQGKMEQELRRARQRQQSSVMGSADPGGLG